MGAFAVTAGISIDGREDPFRAANDDYNAIMAKALADRLAEAFAEGRHRQRRASGATATQKPYPDEQSFRRNIAASGRRRAIRPPRITPKRGCSGRCWHAEKNAGIQLTEYFAMCLRPASADVYFAHPESRYFSLGKIKRDRSRLRGAQRHATSPKSNAGWGPTSTTTPPLRPLPNRLSYPRHPSDPSYPRYAVAFAPVATG